MVEINLIKLDVVDSTNFYMLSLANTDLFNEGLVVKSNFQESGKGQMGRTWNSEYEKNLLFSLLIEPKLKLSYQFILNQIVSVSLVQYLSTLGVKAKIKWPNDIMVDNQKISGILIQNKVSFDLITHSIIGVGLNINQRIFKDYSLKATSVINIINKFTNIDLALHNLLKIILRNLNKYRNGLDFHNVYLTHLFMKGKSCNFLYNDKQFLAVIQTVNRKGLIVLKIKNDLKTYRTGDIKLLIK